MPSCVSSAPVVLRFFLEIDRATMTVAARGRRSKSWQRRIRAYQAYFASPAIVERYGSRKIRVLTVTTGDIRLKSNFGNELSTGCQQRSVRGLIRRETAARGCFTTPESETNAALADLTARFGAVVSAL